MNLFILHNYLDCNFYNQNHNLYYIENRRNVNFCVGGVIEFLPTHHHAIIKNLKRFLNNYITRNFYNFKNQFQSFYIIENMRKVYFSMGGIIETRKNMIITTKSAFITILYPNDAI